MTSENISGYRLVDMEILFNVFKELVCPSCYIENMSYISLITFFSEYHFFIHRQEYLENREGFLLEIFSNLLITSIATK